MAVEKLIWPSRLHHLCLTTGQRPKMIEWYRDTMGLAPEETVDDMTWMRGSQRNLLLQDGEAGGASASSGSMRLAVGERWSGAHCAAAHAS